MLRASEDEALLVGLKRLCRLTGYVTDLLSLAVNRLDHGYAVTFQFSASCTLVTRCALFNAHLARAHLFRVPNQLSTAYAVCACCQITETSLQRAKSTICTAYAVCACCQITETSLHTPETKRCAYSVVSHVGMNVRFFLKFEERTLLQSQQLLLFSKKLVSVFSFSARCHHSCKDVLTFVSFFQNSKSLSFRYERRILSLRFSSAATRSDVPTMVREAVEEDISVDLPPLPCLDLVDEE